MPIKYIDEMDIAEKILFLRLDLNVPIAENGTVKDDTRIRAALPTIKYALEKKARVIVASHLGRPKGERNEKYSLQPVAAYLADVLKIDVIFPEDCIGDAVRKLSSELKPGQLMLLENLRFHKEEEANNPNFAEKLAALCEVYVNDAFGAAHRAHASTVGMVKYVQDAGAGFLMKSEIAALEELVKNPAKPYIAILGGAKVSDKIGVVDNLLDKVNSLLIGGGMAYTFLKAQGYEIGKSLFEADSVHTAKKTLDRAKTRGVQIFLPLDHLIAKEPKKGLDKINTDGADIPAGMMGLDIGSKTIELFSAEIAKASTIFWNGPMGVFEIPPFDTGTLAVTKAIANSKAKSVAGGGDSIAAINQSGLASSFSHICTGGGASLEFLEGKKLPGIVALNR